MKTIQIVNHPELVALVDDSDYDLVKSERWYSKGGGCAYWNGKTVVEMSILIMGRKQGMHIDHIDHNRLNNQRSNLRFVTLQQNNYNQRKNIFNKTGFLGVCMKRNGRYIAQIGCDRKNIHIGIFTDPVDAARARDKKARELFGEYANLNFK